MLIHKCDLKSRPASLRCWQEMQSGGAPRPPVCFFTKASWSPLVLVDVQPWTPAAWPGWEQCSGGVRWQLCWAWSWKPRHATGPGAIGHGQGDKLGPRSLRQPCQALALLWPWLEPRPGQAPRGWGLCRAGGGPGCPQGPGSLRHEVQCGLCPVHGRSLHR